MGLKTYEHVGKKIYNPASSRSRLLITSETGCKIGFGEGATASQKLPARKPVFFKKGAESSLTIDGDCTVSTDGAMEVGTAFRNVLNLNGVSQYAVAPRVKEIDLDDPDLAFEIEIAIRYSSVPINTYLLSQGGYSGTHMSSSTELCITTSGQGRAAARLGGGVYLAFGGAMPEGGCTITVKYSDGVIFLSDGVNTTSTPYAVGGYRADGELYLGALCNTVNPIPNFQGQLRDIKIWTGGDRNTGTLTRHYRMDEGWRGANNQVLVNYATELGEELSTLVTPFDTPVIGSQQDAAVYDINSKENLPQYANLLMRYTAINYIGTSDVGFSSKGGIPSSFRRNRDYDFYGVAEYNASVYSATIAVFAFPNVDSQCTFTNVSVRQADGYGVYVGFTEASWTEEEV